MRVPFDLLLSIVLVRRLTRDRPAGAPLTVLTAVAAAAPDLDSLAFVWPALGHGLPYLTRYVKWHVALQRETSSLWGLLPQLALVAGCLIVARPRPAGSRG